MSVTFRPCLCLVCCGLYRAIIRYDNIKEYYVDDKSYCDNDSYGYGIGFDKTRRGVREHACCSGNCEGKRIVIKYKEHGRICCKNYWTIVIAVDEGDFNELMGLLDTKCAIRATII